MNELKVYGTQEMSVQDQKQIDGGVLGVDDGIVGLIALAITIATVDWDKVADDWSRGWNSL